MGYWLKGYLGRTTELRLWRQELPPATVFHLSGDLGLVPDVFPFVEPGVEIAISCPFCGGTGCAVCKSSGWIELGGAGLVHPNILEHYGIDTDRFSGFAFGLGTERIPMMAYGIDDLRYFLDNDLRFLEQFRA